jgi:2-polyprenyl-3-methyl-5-hydroxy-6-metoxy-1,4-benzoquinol methylase
MITPQDQPHSTSLPWASIADFLTYWLQHNPLSGADRRVFENYYASYLRRFSAYTQHHFNEQTREISMLIRALGHPRLLEIGAGCGTESLWFSLLGARVTAIDVSAERLATAIARRDWIRSHYPHLPLETQYTEQSVFDPVERAPYDLIWMEQTFHHLEPRKQVYGQFASLLRPNGTLVICEVNAWNPVLQLLFFRQRGFRTKKTVTDSTGRTIEYGDERLTTPGALSRGLTRAGFRIVSVRSFRMLPNSAPPKLWLAIERLLVRALPFLSTHYVLVATKGP